MQQTRDLYKRVRSAPQGFQLEVLLAEMKIKLDVQSADLDRIPAKGPLVAVANHPFGVLDGAALTVLLSRIRPDVKILTNSLLEGIPELHERCIFVDPFQTSFSAEKKSETAEAGFHVATSGRRSCHISRWRSLAMECQRGAGYRSRVEHRGRSPDS